MYVERRQSIIKRPHPLTREIFIERKKEREGERGLISRKKKMRMMKRRCGFCAWLDALRLMWAYLFYLCVCLSVSLSIFVVRRDLALWSPKVFVLYVLSLASFIICYFFLKSNVGFFFF